MKKLTKKIPILCLKKLLSHYGIALFYNIGPRSRQLTNQSTSPDTDVQKRILLKIINAACSHELQKNGLQILEFQRWLSIKQLLKPFCD